MSQSGLTPYQDELLEILVEECCELGQEKSKIFRFGMDEMSHHIEGFTHRECLEQELGDLMALVDLIVDSDMGITYNGINAAKERKKTKLLKWMTHPKPEASTPGSIVYVMDQARKLAKKQLNNYKGKDNE